MFGPLRLGNWYSYAGRRLQFTGFGVEDKDNPSFDYYCFQTGDGEELALTHTDIRNVKPARETFGEWFRGLFTRKSKKR